MKGTDHLKMPELVNSEYMVYMDEDERRKYEQMKHDLVVSLPGGEVTAANRCFFIREADSDGKWRCVFRYRRDREYP